MHACMTTATLVESMYVTHWHELKPTIETMSTAIYRRFYYTRMNAHS